MGVRFFYSACTVFLILYTSAHMHGAQNFINRLPPVTWSGYVALDAFLDSREVVGLRDDLIALYPRPKVSSSCGVGDIFGHPKFTMTANRTRIRCTGEAPEICHWIPRMVFEADFAGPVEASHSALRIRHAYSELVSERQCWLFGQYWHPMRPETCTPKTVSLNDGAPISLSARDAQIRYMHLFDTMHFVGAILSQSQGFKSDGSAGTDAIYIRRAIIPNLHAQIRCFTQACEYGFGFDYKKLVPRVLNEQGSLVDEKVHSVSAMAYSTISCMSCDICMQAIYGQNVSDFLSIGGYAVTSENTVTHARCYAPMQTFHLWIDVESKDNQCIIPGLFAGFVKAQGLTKKVNFFDAEGNIISFGANPHIDYVVRISPRVIFTWDQFTISVECEYTGASYGTLDSRAKVHNGVYADNFRVLVAAMYYF